MSDRNRVGRRAGPRRAPLDAAALEELAISYVARFATTSRKLEIYLARKLRERGWDEDAGGEAPVEALVRRLVEKGYVDDAAYARMRSRDLLARGYGARRVDAALGAAGVDERDRAEIGIGRARRAALHMARKRGFGPFGADAGDPADRARREKQLAAMVRAGHSFDDARALIEAPDPCAASAWAHEYDEEESE